MNIERTLNLPKLLAKKSFFLLGPRATGKSFLIRQQFSAATPIINLLKGDVYLRLSAEPWYLEDLIPRDLKDKIVVIDEIQRAPELLNEVHRLIEEQGLKFLLTGSSARKLRGKHVNLLAGRAWQANLFPLTYREIDNFDLSKYLLYGGLPAVYLHGDDELEELQAYVETYLQQEISSEALVRKLPAFTRFLRLASLTNGQMLNFSSIASDVGVSVATVREYYQILEDTLLGFMLPAWTKSVKRKAISTAKFYFFDLGVKNILSEIASLEPRSDLYGQAFEHFIALELRAYISYNRLRKSMKYWRSKHGYEVDFVIGDDIAIEVKTAQKVNAKHFKGLQVLEEEQICKQYILISHDKECRKHNNCQAFYWRDFLDALWAGEIVK